MNRSFGLDLARVAAITLVILSHFVHALEFVGIFGVELFFALSGYLIGGVLYRSLLSSTRWSFEDVRVFWLRRWYRTVPNYLLFLVVAVAYHAHFGGLPTATHFLSFLVFGQNLLSGSNAFYGVSWSLAAEEWFYLTFPVVILAFTLTGMKRRAAFVATTLLFVLAPPVLRELAFRIEPGALVRKMSLMRLDAIFYGVGVAFLIARKPWGASTRVSGMVVGSLIVLGLLVQFGLHPARLGSTSEYRILLVLAPAGFALMLPWLQCLAVPMGWLSFVRSPVTNLSLWSYSIYLSHIPVLFTVYALFGDARDNTAVNLLSKVVGLAACLTLSRFVFVHFEKRITDMRPSERSARLPAGIKSAA